MAFLVTPAKVRLPAGLRLPALVFQLGPIANLEELEVKTLQFQNQKLALRLSQRAHIEEELRQRVDQLEKRQTQDDAVINVINRYWNQLNEDIRILLERFDAETGDEGEKQNEHESTTSFLTQLATWHKEELDEKLASRVQVSQRAVAKIIQVFDHLNQRNERLTNIISGSGRGGSKGGEQNSGEGNAEGDAGGGAKEPKDGNKEGAKEGAAAPATDGEAASKEKSEKDKSAEVENAVPATPGQVDAEVRELNAKLQRENANLHRLNTSLHERNHFLQLKYAESEERIAAEETRKEELQNKVDDLEYEFTKSRMRNGKLETALAETQDKLKMYVDRDGGGSIDRKVVLTNAERKTVEQLGNDLEEQRELAANRLLELERMNGLYKDSLKEVEKLRMELSTLPERVVVETTEYKCLQSQFSVLYNEAMQLKTQLEECRNQVQVMNSEGIHQREGLYVEYVFKVAKNAHMRQIEQMESEELLAQKKLRTEVIQLEDMLAQVRKEYEMLRIEFEQNLAANEQTGPINKEMRNLITSLQSHNVQLKGEVSSIRALTPRAAPQSTFV